MRQKVVVALDTNVWLRTNLMRSAIGSATIFHLHLLGGRLCIPEIVEEELKRNVVKHGLEAAEKISEKMRYLEGIVGPLDQPYVPNALDLEEALLARLNELGPHLLRVPFEFGHARAALGKVLDCVPPNGPKNQQFKDSAIWAALLSVSCDSELHFVTGDHGFYRDRVPSNGLAVNLAEEARDAGLKVILHEDLPSCLRAISSLEVPDFPTNEVGDLIGKLVAPEVAKRMTLN